MSNSTPRAALPEPAAVYMRGCNIDIPEGAPLYTAEQVEQIRRETVQACAEIAEAIVTQHWQDYKRGPHRADPHYQGMSDGAQEVLDAIRALLPVKSDSGHSATADAGASTAPLPDVPGATSGAEPVWCGCGDGITPDTGAKCWICAANDATEIEELRAATQWIPVRERLPLEQDGEVLVRMPDSRCEIAWATYWHGASNDFAGWCFRDPDEDEAPTHWMPLPAAPRCRSADNVSPGSNVQAESASPSVLLIRGEK